MKTLEAQIRETRFGLESRLSRQLAHDDPTSDVDTDLCR